MHLGRWEKKNGKEKMQKLTWETNLQSEGGSKSKERQNELRPHQKRGAEAEGTEGTQRKTFKNTKAPKSLRFIIESVAHYKAHNVNWNRHKFVFQWFNVIWSRASSPSSLNEKQPVPPGGPAEQGHCSACQICIKACRNILGTCH